ncbi:MAG TPA: hypothetical protein PK511_02650 [Chitinophagales bacterium]|nr:hypothetical protein [Chitinophagales bacterium]HMU69935.1 hypothetical protein [Chitinophagales bacterium]HMX04056.1 hypothetical protein [Chitinophagales bacterium]HMZ89224.1 hypothetical protein [Chitinophagales bacterium]HNA57910.1 hypothetical protein [Chitinophagales bacterium]
MNTTTVNYLNIALMLLSAIVAFIIPFELFLFSYAVLGPLHYLTEIGWLHKRKYFSPKKNDYIPLVIITLLIAIPAIISYMFVHNGERTSTGQLRLTEGQHNFIAFFQDQNTATALMFLAFSISLIFILIRNNTHRTIAVGLLAIIGFLIRSNHFVDVLFAMFLPTLIHVFLFTGAFILVGALKSKSTSGYLSILVFLGCSLSFFLIMPDGGGYHISDYAKGSYDVSFFGLNHQLFSSFLHESNPTNDMIYNSSTGILITRFIAYAYTYHYLNWFSKTSVIKWHDVPKGWLVTIGVLWVSAVTLYYINYETGLMCLYFLSFLHVVLEFPLNFQSFKQIGEQVRLRLSGKSAAT